MKCLCSEYKSHIIVASALVRNTVFHPRNGMKSYFIHQNDLGNLQYDSWPKLFDMEEDCIIYIDESGNNTENVIG